MLWTPGSSPLLWVLFCSRSFLKSSSCFLISLSSCGFTVAVGIGFAAGPDEPPPPVLPPPPGMIGGMIGGVGVGAVYCTKANAEMLFAKDEKLEAIMFAIVLVVALSWFQLAKQVREAYV